MRRILKIFNNKKTPYQNYDKVSYYYTSFKSVRPKSDFFV